MLSVTALCHIGACRRFYQFRRQTSSVQLCRRHVYLWQVQRQMSPNQFNIGGSQNGSSSGKRIVDLNDRLSISVSFALSLLALGTYTAFAPRPVRKMRKVVLCSLLFNRLISPRQCFGFSSSLVMCFLFNSDFRFRALKHSDFSPHKRRVTLVVLSGHPVSTCQCEPCRFSHHHLFERTQLFSCVPSQYDLVQSHQESTALSVQYDENDESVSKQQVYEASGQKVTFPGFRVWSLKQCAKNSPVTLQ